MPAMQKLSESQVLKREKNERKQAQHGKMTRKMHRMCADCNCDKFYDRCK